ncbi:MAG: hypothetical protein K2K29_04525, partial [Muribaculaceae bacterium]|nr:hypothetical protein [Muribaculaceae bacterium]
MKGKLKYFSVIWLGAMLMALLPAISAFAENGEPDDIAVGIADMSIPSESATAGEGLTASLITCAPGPEVYELFGHEAI